MEPSFALSLAALGGWRKALGRRLDGLAHFLGERDLFEGAAALQIASMRERIGNERLVLAFVAEFSRGKSELINAIFFADTGRRILPATPGRTTMCPVELGWNDAGTANLSLLPIETRLEGLPLRELRSQPRAWRRLLLDVDDPEQLAQSLLEVTRTEWVARDQARALGFWDDDRPDDNPPVDAQGRVEIPAWRHALINYPHPLLQQGLVVLDTPGLNAIGAEPELTLSLLPTAHATVFILGADTGVTRSDMSIWRDHLGAHGPTRFVVLNKIDALEDPLATPEQVQAQIEAQRSDTAQTLDLKVERVFPLSARRALAARVAGDDAGLIASRLPALEAALGDQLLPQRRAVLEQVVIEGTRRIESQVTRQIGDDRRQLAEQMLELRGLRGSNSAKVRVMLQRIDAETAEFEQCTTLLQAMRSIHARMLKALLVELSSDRLRDEVAEMQRAMSGSVLRLGAKGAFVALCERLHGLLASAAQRSAEIREMLAATFARLNAEFGFSLAVGKAPELGRFADELRLIESNYVQYLGLTLSLRLAQPRFMQQFALMLVSKLRVVYENASAEIELWNRATSGQVDSQLRERRRNFKRRRETLERVRFAAGELEARIGQIELQDRRLLQSLARVQELGEALREHARAASLDADGGDESGEIIAPHPAPRLERSVDLPLFDDVEPADKRRARA
ncbi:MAG: dynamin family protein [Caldimonas sp.]